MTSAAILSPISPQQPCGPSLEYDHEFAMLFARMVPRADAQYGDFVGTPEALNWAEVERDCQRLLLRTKDINLLVWMCRARTRLGQAAGLAQMLGTLKAVLHAWPGEVHPQMRIEGEHEPAVRANALAALADPEGLLGDVSELVVSGSTAMRLTVRDVERAFGIPRHADALDPLAVAQQLGDLRASACDDARAPVHALAEAAEHLRSIDEWSREQLGEHAPPLHGLRRVLELFVVRKAKDAPRTESAAEGVGAGSAGNEGHGVASFSGAGVGSTGVGPGSRAEVVSLIRMVREWFERQEPSSPVAVLLKQAERSAGKRFSEVADSIPLDLLRKWDGEDDQKGANE